MNDRRLTERVPRLSLRAGEAAACLGVSRDLFDSAIAPEIRAVRVGRLRLYPVKELDRWVERNAARVLEGL